MRVLAFYHFTLFPPRIGSDWYFLSVLKALRQLNCEVTVFMTNLYTREYLPSSEKTTLAAEHGIQAISYQATDADRNYYAKFEWDLSCKSFFGYFAPPDMKKAFVEFAGRYQPDWTVISYSVFSDLINHPVFRNSRTLLISHDLISNYVQLVSVINANLLYAIHQAPSPALHDTFLADNVIRPWREEFEWCDRYDITAAISMKEASVIKSRTQSTQVAYLPATADPVETKNSYRKDPVFLATANYPNVLGFDYFSKRVLPLLRHFHPKFNLDIFGSIRSSVEPVDGLTLRGIIPDLSSAYRDASYAICPLIAATGQQIKVLEAMSYGLPVVIHKAIAETSPVIHGVNGFVAASPDEFAQYCLMLSGSRTLCRKLGNAARALVREQFNRDSMKVRLRGILEAVENPAPNRNQIISAPRAPVKASGPRKKTPRISIVIMPGPASTIERTVDELIPFRSTMEVFAVGFNKATRSRVDAYLPITWRRTFDEALPSMRGDLVVFLVEGDRLFPETVAFLPSTPSGPILFSSRPAFCDQDGTVTDILDAPLLQATDEPWAQRASCLFPRKRLQSLPKPLREVVPNGTWFHKVIAHLNGKTDRIRFIDLCTGATCLSASKGSMSFRNRQCLPAIMHQRQALIKKRRIQSPRLPSTMLSENFAFHIRRQQEQAACLHEAHIRRRWTDLGREMQGKRGAILGAGKWTDWLLSVTAQLSPSPCISYILDDNPRFDALKGIPVARLDEVPVDSCDFIILGSDSITHELRNRVNRSKMSNKQMITLYDEVGTPGPFPKATCSTTNHSAKGNQT